MPTGYTAIVANDVSFEDFVMRCARGMGALISMRDEPLDSPIPDRFEPSDFYAKKAIKAKEEFAFLSALTDEEAEKAAAERYDKEETRRVGMIKEGKALKDKYNAMLRKVERWEPPTSDHVGFKEFMIDQIRRSIEFDCDTSYFENAKPQRLSGKEWRQKAAAEAIENIERYKDEYENEVERVEERNAWLRALRNSLGISTNV